ncbi:hypothetical protein V1264_015078 [Littorina saxatilis]|uniref:Uncharacterized protein n=1 Tax=Littorina saxatilis TaxID=31220 RepID=A0AAN9GG26_9CAEN
MCRQWPSMRQRVVDPLLKAGKEAEHIPHAQPTADPRNQVVRPGNQQRGPGTCYIMPSMYTLLRQLRLRWFGHVRKHLLYDELASGKRAQGRPQLCYRDVCKRDMKALDMNINGLEDLAQDRARWRQDLKRSLAKGDEKLKLASEAQRLKTKKKNSKVTTSDTVHKCGRCGRDCHSRIGLHSHCRRCFSAK